MNKKPEYIIGIGASAGGLEAIQDFFDHMPANTGMAFVVIQHLSPDFKSLMDQLLKRNTEMNIYPVEDKMVIQANTIYLIPPKQNMTIENGQLCLTEQVRGHYLNLPVDIFFESLARECGSKAVGIVLSGTGSDGSKGLVEISNAGGLVIVQDPDTAKFDGMPRNAITTKHVKCVLDVLQIPKAVMDYCSNPSAFNEDNYITNLHSHTTVYDYIFELLRKKFKTDFNLYKPTTISRRIDRRAKTLSLESLIEYRDLLESDPLELEQLYKDLLIGVTAFFRDPEAFDKLKEEVILPLIKAKKDSREEIRVWVAACSTGEEAYSIAILFKEALKKSQFQGEIKIFASDISNDFLSVAGQGRYNAASLAVISEELRDRYFQKIDDVHYSISPDIRRMVVFASHNILSDAPFTKMDLVSCRNFLIYVQPLIQKKVLNLLRFSLKKEGALFLGPSETVSDVERDFDVISSNWKLFRKVIDTRRDIDFSAPNHKDYSSKFSTTYTNHAYHSQVQMKALEAYAYDYLLDHFIPDGILLNSDLNILYVFGASNTFLSYPAGRAHHNIMTAINKQLKAPVSTALHKARYNEEEVCYTDIEYQEGNKTKAVKLVVTPIKSDRRKVRYLLLQISYSKRKKASQSNAQVYHPAEESAEIVKGLESELQHTRESLQSTIEEVETTNEELQSTNEELLASNEELQSTNEELHSVNEELYTVNSEYQKKIEELTEKNNDIDNLLRSTNIGTIFLDKSLNIRLFTPAVAKIFDLTFHDIGRPLKSFSHNIDSADIDKLISQVFKESKSIIKEVYLSSGSWYLMQILPYLNQNGINSGVILTFLNISDIKTAQEVIALNEQRYKTIIDKSTDLIWIANCRGEFGRKNEKWLAYTGQTYQAAEKFGWIDAVFEKDRNNFHQCWLKSISAEQPFFIEAQVWSKAHACYRHVKITSAPILDGSGKVVEWAGTLTDIHSQKENDVRLQLMFQSIPIAMMLVDSDGKIHLANSPAKELFGYSKTELMNMQIESLIPHENRDKHKKLRARYSKAPVNRKTGGGNCDFLAIKKDGSTVSVEVNLTPISLANENYILCTVIDVTLRKEAEKILKNTNQILEKKVSARTQELQCAHDELKESEQRYSVLYDCAPDMYASISAKDASILHCNETLVKVLGYSSKNEIIGRAVFDLYSESCLKQVKKFFKKFQKTGEVEGDDLYLVKKDKSLIPVILKVSAVRDSKGKILYSMSSWRDISAQKALEKERQLRVNNEKLFSENKKIYDAILDATTDGWWDWNLETNDEYLSPKFKTSLGYKDDEMPNRAESWQKIIYKEDLPLAVRDFEAHIQQGKPFSPIVRYHCKDGSTKWILCRGKALQDDDGQFRRMIGTHTDITELKEIEAKLNDNLLELSLIYKGTKLFSDSTNIDLALQSLLKLVCQSLQWQVGHIYKVNIESNKLETSRLWHQEDKKSSRVFKSITEKTHFEMGVGLPGRVWKAKKPAWIEDIYQDDNFPRAKHSASLNLHAGVAFPIIADGMVYAVCELFTHNICPESKELIRIFELLGAQVGTVIEKNLAKERLSKLAHYDVVTGLPNRVYFQDVLERTIERAKRVNSLAALMFLDLDNFKKVNDSLGHEIGDKLLKQVSKVIQDASRQIDFFARIGGDEFVILMEDLKSPRHAAKVANRIVTQFAEPLYIDEHKINTSVSIGLAMYPKAGEDANALLKCADMAMYQAKNIGRNNFQFYSDELNQLHQRQLDIEEGLRIAIEKDEFNLLYQPIISTGSKNVYGVEVLLRWESESLGAIMPDEFIPVAEDAGLINNIGLWVFETAVKQLSHWNKHASFMDGKKILLSINLSILQLTNNAVVCDIKSILKKYRVKPHQIMFEIIESKLMENISTSKLVLNQLNELGIGIAVDDFGTGYSSMSYLKHLPLTLLKIDKSFVRDVLDDSNDASIVEAIIQMSVAIGLKTIAEGVETKDQLEFLTELGCDYAQGYYISKPVSAKELLNFFKSSEA